MWGNRCKGVDGQPEAPLAEILTREKNLRMGPLSVATPTTALTFDPPSHRVDRGVAMPGGSDMTACRVTDVTGLLVPTYTRAYV